MDGNQDADAGRHRRDGPLVRNAAGRTVGADHGRPGEVRAVRFRAHDYLVIFVVIGLVLILALPRGCWEQSSLEAAAERGDTQEVIALRRAGFDPGSTEAKNALRKATEAGHVETAAALVEAGIDPSASLKTAAGRGNLPMLAMLLGAGADPDGAGEKSREAAVRNDDHGQSVFKWLESRGAPLRAAVRNGHTEVVIELIEAGADPSSGLKVAAGGGNMPLVSVLLEAGADPDGPQGDEALEAAVRSGHSEVVLGLIEAGADPWRARWALRSPGVREPRSGLLEIAADRGDMPTVAILLEAGNTSDLVVFQIDRALEAAVHNGHTAVALALVDADADPFAGLEAAAGGGNMPMVATLLEAGSKSDLAVIQRNRALEAAVRNGHTEVALGLIDAGADPSAALETAAGGGKHADGEIVAGSWREPLARAARRRR